MTDDPFWYSKDVLMPSTKALLRWFAIELLMIAPLVVTFSLSPSTVLLVALLMLTALLVLLLRVTLVVSLGRLGRLKGWPPPCNMACFCCCFKIALPHVLLRFS